MNAALKALLDASATFTGLLPDQKDVVYAHLLALNNGVANDSASINTGITDFESLTDEQKFNIELYLLTKKVGYINDAHAINTTAQAVTGKITVGKVKHAKDFIKYKALGGL